MSTAPSSRMVPDPPALAERVFGDRLELAVRYGRWLAGAGVARGLIGPREAERLWDRHLLNCVAAAALIQPSSNVVDLGSGAGLPGIVIAIARPDVSVMLVESMLRRITFLEVVVADLGLDQVTVRRARAEELKKPRLRADVVLARAVAPLGRLVAMAAPLLRPGGELIALKGAGVIDEVAAGWAGARRAGMVDGAALFAVRAGGVGPAGGGDGPPEQPSSEASQLPGAELFRAAAWLPDGSRIPDGAADEATIGSDSPSLDPNLLAWVLRLRLAATGSPRASRAEARLV